jgi:ubiquinone/menaquinone biosynthesis C-methylase UbiE
MIGMSNTQVSRVTRSKNDAQRFYSHISRLYDVSEGSFEKKYIQMGISQLMVQKEDVVLEIGCGTGEGVIDFARRVGSSGKVYGVDIARGMLEVTRLKLMKERLLSRVELLWMDAVRLPFQDNFFDRVFMSFTLELFDTPEIPLVLSECVRVLKNKGRIGVVSLSKKNSTMMTRMYEWLHGVLPRMLDCRPIVASEVVQDAGFRIMNSSLVSMWGLPVEILVGEVTK